MINSFIFFFAGLIIAAFTTPWVIRLSECGIGMDRPDESRKTHAEPVPRLGGAPLMLSVSLGLCVILFLQPDSAANWFPILLGSLLMYGLGLWDDLKPLGARFKLAGADFPRLRSSSGSGSRSIK